MKQQFTPEFLDWYNLILHAIKMQIYMNSTQKEVAKKLGIQPSNLSKILSGVYPCNSKTFLALLDMHGFQIVKGLGTKYGTIYPGIYHE